MVDGCSAEFQESAESQIAAALGVHIAPAAEAIRRELETLRIAFARAAGEQAEAAARTARGHAVEQAQACLAFERARADEQLESVQAEAAAQREADRREHTALREALDEATAAHTQLVADLRAQLEHAQAVPQQARAHADRVERAASPPPHPPAVRQAEHEVPEDGPFAALFNALDEATTRAQALDALLDGVGAANGRAALFLVKPEKLQGWRSVGFEREAAITSTFELPLSTDSTLTRAATTGQTIVPGNGLAPDARPAGAAREPWTVTLPVMLGDRIIAVVYTDEGAQLGNWRSPLDRAAAFDVTERLARRAGRRLAALTATDRIGDSDVKPEAPAAEPVHLDGAQEYARVLASEMTRYYETDASAESPDEHLSKHFKDEIERCRRQSTSRVPLEAGSTGTVLDETIFERFGRVVGR